MTLLPIRTKPNGRMTARQFSLAVNVATGILPMSSTRGAALLILATRHQTTEFWYMFLDAAKPVPETPYV